MQESIQVRKPSITHLQLPFQFDVEKLEHDLQVVNELDWTSIIYKQNYTGDWNSLSLYAFNGDALDSSADNNGDKTLVPTPAVLNCGYFQEVIASFKSQLLSVRLLKLSAGSKIKPHSDFRLGYEDNNCRIHIPITTNNQVSFMLNGEQLNLLPGTCWYINANFTHAVSNLGTEDRVHLVIDLERNDWTDNIFFSLAPKESFAIESEEFSPEVLREMIQQLEGINTQETKELVKEYKERLKHLEITK